MNKEEENAYIKARMQAYMTKKNLTENQLAIRSGITQSTINAFMNKNRSITTFTLKKICDGLEISIKDFFDFKPFNEFKIEKNTHYRNEPELSKDFKDLMNEVEIMKKELKELKKEEYKNINKTKLNSEVKK